MRTRPLNMRVGALGCPGVDVEKWRGANAVRLYPGHANQWLLAREIDSNPSEELVKSQLVSFFAKSFEREISDYPNQVLGFNNVGPADGIKIVGASRDRPPFDAVQRREQLPLGPLPMLKASNILYLHVTFNYRGILEWIPWPTAKLGIVAKVSPSGYDFCPVDADIMLLAAGPMGDEAGRKRTVGTILGGAARETVTSAATFYMGWMALTAVGLGIGLYVFKKVL